MNLPTAGLMLVARVHYPDGRTVRQAVANGGGFTPARAEGPLLVALPNASWIRTMQDQNTTAWRVPVRSPDFAPEIFQKLLAFRVGWLNPQTYRTAKVLNKGRGGAFHLVYPQVGSRSDHFWIVGDEILVAEVRMFTPSARGPTAAPRLVVHLWDVRADRSDAGLPELVVTRTTVKDCRISQHDTAWRTGEGSELAVRAVQKAGLQI